jgi:hypothetical protein
VSGTVPDDPGAAISNPIAGARRAIERCGDWPTIGTLDEYRAAVDRAASAADRAIEIWGRWRRRCDLSGERQERVGALGARGRCTAKAVHPSAMRASAGGCVATPTGTPAGSSWCRRREAKLKRGGGAYGGKGGGSGRDGFDGFTGLLYARAETVTGIHSWPEHRKSDESGRTGPTAPAYLNGGAQDAAPPPSARTGSDASSPTGGRLCAEATQGLVSAGVTPPAGEIA